MSQTCFTKFGLIFFIVGMIMVLSSTFPLLAFINDIIAGQNLPLLFILAIFAFMGLIFYLVGYILMCVGGIAYREFGEKHRKFLLISLIILIIVIVISLIQSIYQSFTIYNIRSVYLQNGLFDLSPMKNIMYFSVAVTAVSGLFYVFILHELENKIGKILIYVSYISSIVFSILTVYFFISYFDTWSSQLSEILSNSESSMSIFGQSYQDTIQITQGLTNEITKYSVFGIIPSILWLIAMIIPLYRIIIGDLKMVINTTPSDYNEFGSQFQSEQNFNQKICPKCGSKNKSGSNFCEECGYRFS